MPINLPTYEQQEEILEAIENKSGGTDFNARILKGGEVAATHQSNLTLNVTGKGILHTIYSASSSGTTYVTVQIDNGEIQTYFLNYNGNITFLVGFSNSLKIYQSAAGNHVRLAYSLEV